MSLHLHEANHPCKLFDPAGVDDDADRKDEIYERLMEPGRYETDNEGCMIFCGAWTKHGVGRVRVGARVYNVARVAAWVFFDVPLWSDQVVYHRCTSPACFAPDHIDVAPNRSIAFALRRLWRVRRMHLIPRPTGALRAHAEAIRFEAGQGSSLYELAAGHGHTELEILGLFSSQPKGSHREPSSCHTRRAA